MKTQLRFRPVELPFLNKELTVLMIIFTLGQEIGKGCSLFRLAGNNKATLMTPDDPIHQAYSTLKRVYQMTA